MNYSLVSLKTSKLNKKKIIQISNLKDSHWSFGINSQLEWFKNKIKKNDIHNLLYFKSKLIGYTLLRRRSFNNNNKLKRRYLLFDTFIIHKDYRNKKLSNLLMIFNNTIIRETGLFSFLICKNKVVSFYKRHNWKKLNKKNIKVVDHPFSTNGMLFNTNNIKKYYFYINK
tara:strand:+ start:103 stop:612 length:510 start_codon:yes stop_codon:yes gene_type:complete